MSTFENQLSLTGSLVSSKLDELLSAETQVGEIFRPKKLLSAMRHGALNGGKRLRPFLVLESAALFGIPTLDAMRTASAVECVHCYSLIHDDLPSMDDDDLRRGKPTVHKAFDEATAILAGDALITLAFDTLADPQTHQDPSIRADLILQLARASGAGGMVGGQVLDIEAETIAPEQEGIELLQSMKTGALLRYSCEAGAILGKANIDERNALKSYGQKIGAAFQLADDLLDLTSTTEQMGKKVAKDDEQGKGTLVAILGEEAARKKSEELVSGAIAELESFGENAQMLIDCAKFIIERRN